MKEIEGGTHKGMKENGGGIGERGKGKRGFSVREKSVCVL